MQQPRNASSNEDTFNWGREELLGLLSNAANLAGLCVTVVALMNTFDRANAAATIVDDMFAVCAALYLICTYVIFWALRARKGIVPPWLMRTVDGIFLLAFTTMTVSSFLLIYTVW
jgi:Co/Zn/Cd efflux system component